MAEKKYCEETEKLARIAKALAHPARIAIVQFLAKQDSCYFGDIHEELPIAKATVSQHLKELKDAASRLGAALDFFVYDSIKIVLGLLFNGAL